MSVHLQSASRWSNSKFCNWFLRNADIYWPLMYEGRSINKLQNGINLSVFKLWKIRNIHYVGNLLGNTYMLKFRWQWHHYCILRMQSVSAGFCSSASLFLHNSPGVKLHCELGENWTSPQAHLFKRQSLRFHFSAWSPNSYLDLSSVRTWEKTDYCDHCSGRWNDRAARSFLINTVLSMSKHLTINMHCWSHKTPVTVY